MSDWIKCSERMPDVGKLVLIFRPYGDGNWTMDIDSRNDQKFGGLSIWRGVRSYQQQPTHWMPIPKAPEET